MKIFTIWGQRTCSYPGEYAPELLAAADEYTEDDNPGYLDEEENKYLGYMLNGEFSFIKRLTIDIERRSFDKAFFPDKTPLSGKIE